MVKIGMIINYHLLNKVGGLGKELKICINLMKVLEEKTSKYYYQ